MGYTKPQNGHKEDSNHMKNLLLGAVFLAAIGASPASAALQVAADINGASFFCSDGGGACDTSPTLGVIITANTTLDGIVFSSSSASSGTGALNFLNASNLLITNTNANAVDIVITVSSTDFTTPVRGFTDASSGVWQGTGGSTATFRWFVDPLNRQGADTVFDLPGTLIDTDTSSSGAQRVLSFAHNNPFIGDPVNGPFSMTETITLHLAAGESLVNRGQTIVGEAVPEPSTWAMLSLGFITVGALGWKRSKHSRKGARLATI